MEKKELKIMRLDEAVRSFVKEGDHLSLGGFTINRNPMAAVHEILRQKIGNLHVYAHSNGQGLDELVGASAVKRIEIAYSGNGRFAPTCFCFRRAAEEGRITVEDYTNYQMALRFLAGSMGIPFMPTYSSLGSDIIEKWGFDIRLRRSEMKISDQKVVIMENPFQNREEGQKVVLVPAIIPDVTIIHAQSADGQGNVSIQGLTFADVEQAKASRHVIVTCEEILSREESQQNLMANHLPSFCVDAVVPVPFGAYPTACFGWYDYDPIFFEQYREIASSRYNFSQYLQECIYATVTHDEFINLFLDEKRKNQITADPEKGYASGMRRN